MRPSTLLRPFFLILISWVLSRNSLVAQDLASDDVPEALAQQARQLAEQHRALAASLEAEQHVVYVGTERLRVKTEDGEEDPRKIYRVIHYRYKDNAAILSVVDLAASKVLSQQAIANLSTSLAIEELETAKELALNDPQVREALGEDVNRVVIEALVIRTFDKQDPLYARRAVQLLFRVGRDYRHSPRVVVNLTEQTVSVHVSRTDGGGGLPRPNESSSASDDVPEGVAQMARQLAEQHHTLAASLNLKQRVVYIGTEVLRVKTVDGEEDPIRIHRVIHYRYEDNAAIHSVVDLVALKVIKQQAIANLPTSLSREELETAKKLALNDREVREALGEDLNRVNIEALVIRTFDKQDPLYAQRAVQLLFRVGRDYRHSPRVLVNLTKKTVAVHNKEKTK